MRRLNTVCFKHSFGFRANVCPWYHFEFQFYVLSFIPKNLKLSSSFSVSNQQTRSCAFLQAVRHSHMRMDTAHLFLHAQISFSSCRQTTSSPMLAWIPLLFSQASIFRSSCLPGFLFSLHRQAFSRFFACLDSLSALQASILSLFSLPGLLFFLSGKHFPAFQFAWISLLAFRQSVVP